MSLNNTNQSTSTIASSSSSQPNQTHQQALASITAAIASLQSQQAVLSHENDTIKTTTSPPSYKIIGIVLALVSGVFIGSSFVLKKKGLLKSQQTVLDKGGKVGEGHAYLKSLLWWSGMLIMVVGEICNFVAYAFADAILVTPMGALSVVICAILSSIFLKERLSFFGKLGCLLCILGATVIALNAPQEQAVSTISEFKKLFLAPGFLVFASFIIITALLLIFVAAPRWGKTNMFVYISVCSLIGGLSVVSTQGLGASIITSIKGDNQFKNWFMYFLIGFVVCTLLTEINYLNKALELFNTAMVTPTYYVMFTFSTLVTSIILFQGLKSPILDIVTLVLGFLVICVGITLLQMSKINPSQIRGLDRRSSMFLAVDKEPEDEHGTSAEEPGMDGLRGFAGVLGSMHRTSLIARQSRSSKQSPIRPESGMSPRIGGSNDLEMTDNGLSRHSLWDRPIDDSVDGTYMPESPQSQDSKEAYHLDTFKPLTSPNGTSRPIRPMGTTYPNPIKSPIINEKRLSTPTNAHPYSISPATPLKILRKDEDDLQKPNMSFDKHGKLESNKRVKSNGKTNYPSSTIVLVASTSNEQNGSMQLNSNPNNPRTLSNFLGLNSHNHHHENHPNGGGQLNLKSKIKNSTCKYNSHHENGGKDTEDLETRTLVRKGSDESEESRSEESLENDHEKFMNRKRRANRKDEGFLNDEDDGGGNSSRDISARDLVLPL